MSSPSQQLSNEIRDVQNEENIPTCKSQKLFNEELILTEINIIVTDL
jgi:hypothetical protein